MIDRVEGVRQALLGCRARLHRALRRALGLPRRQQLPLVHVDSPQPGSGSTAPYVLVAGWVGADADAEAIDLRLVDDTGRTWELATLRRPDAEASHSTRRVVGFQRLLSLEDLEGQGSLLLEGVVGAHRVDHRIPIDVPIGRSAALADARARKLTRIRPLLRCPRCESAGLVDEGSELRCSACGHPFARTPSGGVDVLPDDLRDRFRISDTENISAWGYDATARAVLERHRDGLVLDCGCGLRPEYLDQVVNYEVVDYPTTDVLGVGQALPFVDDAFDAVFSFAVLEHVTDPFRCAAELTRVLKPGGTLFAVVPFLQPFHGYPDHYYNMTASGLRNLFGDGIDVEVCEVPETGAPVFALSWMLNSYARGLPSDVAARFEKMTVGELMGEPSRLLDLDVVRRLDGDAIVELAATNALIGRKRV